MRGLAAVGAMRLSVLLRGRIDDEVFSRYPRILDQDVNGDDIATAEEYLAAVGDPQVENLRIRALMRILWESEVARSLFELTALRLLEPKAPEVLEIASGGNGNGVTLLTAARAAGFTGEIFDALQPMREAEEIVRFLTGAPANAENDFYRTVYRFDEYLIGAITGCTAMDRAFADFAELRDAGSGEPACYGMEQEVGTLSDKTGALTEAGGRLTVLISGENESGRYTAAKAVAEHNGLSLLAVDFSYLMGTEEPKEVLRRLVRTCVLEERALAVRGITRSKDTVFLIERLQRLYERYSERPLFLLTAADVKLAPSMRGRYLSMQIPKGPASCIALWKGYLPEEQQKLAESLASKMNLTAGQVRRVCEALETARAAGEEPDERMICRLCYEVLDDGRYDNVKRIEPGFTLDDVKIDAHNRSVLEDICRQVELRHQVYDGWDLKKKYAYGRCVSVILAGPPGTGKTMTVHALAGQLGLELYKVDLSQIVDKYIGETEKRLEEVFAKAQKSNMILFFDEADAVMGKRSEVKDAKDKYANTEISFILQRIEEYDGIVFLATNNLQNIDQAFMRRIRYVMTFKLPDRETREQIWRSAFGKKVPLSEDIDYEFLAEKFELSGGEIKNIVLNAVFYGAADGGEVAMRHIMKAVYRENTKLKRIAFDGDYGGYAYLLHD